MKRALLVGSRGQDGSYLLRQLGARGYEVVGIDRGGIQGAAPRSYPPVSIQNKDDVLPLVADFQPDEIYYLAAVHHSSEEMPVDDQDLVQRSFEINTLSLSNFLAAVERESRHSRLFYAASSHVFGDPPCPIQDEDTPLNPTCPYGISKAAGLQLCRYYRRMHSLYCSAGILYNHESPLRPAQFISQKIVRAAVRIKNKAQDKLVVGNLDALVDWGYAPDYVEAMWIILQLQEPADFVIASGTLHSVRDFVEAAFEHLGLSWKEYVVEDPALMRKRTFGALQGKSAKLQSLTGWRPKTTFREMVRDMVQAEMEKWTSRESDSQSHL